MKNNRKKFQNRIKPERMVIPSRFLPLGSRRITNALGIRVWLINGREHRSKAAYFDYLKSGQAESTPTEVPTAAKVEVAEVAEVADV